MLIVGGGIPPSFFNGGGDAPRVKRDAHPSLPYVHPSPPYVPVTPYVQLKFLVGNNLSPPSPLLAQYYLPAMVLTQSIKSLAEKVKENPYFQYREGWSRKCGVFPHSVSF